MFDVHCSRQTAMLVMKTSINSTFFVFKLHLTKYIKICNAIYSQCICFLIFPFSFCFFYCLVCFCLFSFPLPQVRMWIIVFMWLPNGYKYYHNQNKWLNINTNQYITDSDYNSFVTLTLIFSCAFYVTVQYPPLPLNPPIHIPNSIWPILSIIMLNAFPHMTAFSWSVWNLISTKIWQSFLFVSISSNTFWLL